MPPRLLLSLLAIAPGVFSIAPARADIGSDIALLLQAQYRDTRADCGGPDKPAVLCSGVLVRATKPSTDYPFYSVSPTSLAQSRVSGSYLRQDAKFQKLAYGMTSGFIFNNMLRSDGSWTDHQVQCAYPIDGATDNRATTGGCGDYILKGDTQGVVEDLCHRLGIETAEQWMARYVDASGQFKYVNADGSFKSGEKICAFDISPGNPRAAIAFQQSLRVEAMLIAKGRKFNGSSFQENEIVLKPWRVDVPRSPDLLAAFYTDSTGVKGARINQVQWYQATRQFLPAISLTMPATAQQDARFAYDVAKQAIQQTSGPDACERYVESAKWVSRYDPGFRKNIMSLEIVPTACGRQTQAEQTNNFFNELVAQHYLDPAWLHNADNPANNILGMRRQLVCVLTVARSKTSWFLEPSRPYTTHEKSVAAGCNNTTA